MDGDYAADAAAPVDEKPIEKSFAGGGHLAEELNAACAKAAARLLSPGGDGKQEQPTAPTGNKTSNIGLIAQIESLKEEQKKQRLERKKVASELKNARRRKSRLKCKARLLSNDDLALVLAMRQETAAQREASVALESPSPGAAACSSGSSPKKPKQA